MTDIYPMDGRSNYQPGDYNSDTDVFLVAVGSDDAVVACGALRWFSDGVVGVKRMYVVPEARAQGIGRQLLERLEQEARGVGYETDRVGDRHRSTDTRDYARCFAKSSNETEPPAEAVARSPRGGRHASTSRSVADCGRSRVRESQTGVQGAGTNHD